MVSFKKFLYFISIVIAAIVVAVLVDKNFISKSAVSNSWVKNRYKAIYQLILNTENNFHYILGSCGGESSFDLDYFKQKGFNFQNISVRGSSPKEYKQIIELMIQEKKLNKNTKIIIATQLSELTMKSEKIKNESVGNKFRDENLFDRYKLDNNDFLSMSYLPIVKNYIRIFFDKNWNAYRSISLNKKFNSSIYFDYNKNGHVDFENIENINDLNEFTSNWQKNEEAYKDFLESMDGRVSLNWSKKTISEFIELFNMLSEFEIKYYWIIMPEIEIIRLKSDEFKMNEFISFLKIKKINYIDFSKKSSLTDNDFIDADHLNHAGARILTREFYEKIK